MRRPATNSDLDKASQRMARKQQRLADYRTRTQPVRDRVRRLELLTAGIRGGWLA